jgi:hypothetical protein
VREREDANRTRVAGHLDEIQGVVANTLNGACGKQSDIDGQAEGRASGSERVTLLRQGIVGFIEWLGLAMEQRGKVEPKDYLPNKDHDSHYRMRANAP